MMVLSPLRIAARLRQAHLDRDDDVEVESSAPELIEEDTRPAESEEPQQRQAPLSEAAPTRITEKPEDQTRPLVVPQDEEARAEAAIEPLEQQRSRGAEELMAESVPAPEPPAALPESAPTQILEPRLAAFSLLEVLPDEPPAAPPVPESAPTQILEPAPRAFGVQEVLPDHQPSAESLWFDELLEAAVPQRVEQEPLHENLLDGQELEFFADALFVERTPAGVRREEPAQQEPFIQEAPVQPMEYVHHRQERSLGWLAYLMAALASAGIIFFLFPDHPLHVSFSTFRQLLSPVIARQPDVPSPAVRQPPVSRPEPQSAPPASVQKREPEHPAPITTPPAPKADVPAATGRVAKLTKVSDMDSGRRLNAIGYGMMKEGRYSEAVPILKQAVAAYPPDSQDLNYAYALFNLAHALRKLGRPDEAIPLLQERLKIDNQRTLVEQELEAAQREAATLAPKS